jgi:hypothetical protein
MNDMNLEPILENILVNQDENSKNVEKLLETLVKIKNNTGIIPALL